MEGKKYRALGQDCRAVSEVIGQVLMVAIVVLAFSSIALTVFSDGGAVNPPHVPRTDLQESVNTKDNKIQVFHSGGETIDLKDIKVILSVDGQQAEFNMSDSGVAIFGTEGSKSPNDVFMLGDYIVIDPGSVNITGNITGGNATLYFVHTASRQVIKKAIL